MKKVIGTNKISYPQIRNFSGLPFQKYRFEKKQNLHKIPGDLYAKLTNRRHEYFMLSYRDFDLQKVDFFHFFNALSYGKKPWLTTFETSIPRWGKRDIKKGLELIARESCKKIIAISNCTANIQRITVNDSYPEFNMVIDEKLMILHPPQKCLPIEEIKKDMSGEIIFTMVGGDFFRKGGKEVLLAFDRLFQRGIRDWHLNIISKMQYGDYASQTTVKDLELANKIIAKYPNHITQKRYIPNHEVIELFRTSHIGLLPTYADTYGFSVLESQACGAPVISTDCRALPEINNAEQGWVIPVKKDQFGNAILNTEKAVKDFSDNLVNELDRILGEIFDNPASIIEKGLKGYKSLENSIAVNTEILENIYDEIVDSSYD